MLKKVLSILTIMMVVVMFSCEVNEVGKNEIPQRDIDKISELGFSTQDVKSFDGGYLVEGDIFLEKSNLDEISDSPTLRIANVEQYRTTNLVKSLPRVITVSVSGLTQVYGDATNEAIARYNALNLGLTFQRVSARGNIDIVGFYEAPSGGFITLGSAGFPTRNGNPYRQIKMNTHPQAYGTNPDLNYLASVLQHEIGHCIGFRHTDYMDRSFSCGPNDTRNEGAGSVGAIHIPGTPTSPDNGSWMLACSGGVNRTFNANDRIALDYLY
jgi:hypothetical protein